MKQKILEALKQGHKNLGLNEEAFERVAAFGETFVTSEDGIADFVKKAEPFLKAEQSAADKVRSELNGKIKALEGEKAELEAKLKEGANAGGGEPEGGSAVAGVKEDPKVDNNDLLTRMEALFEAKMKPLQERIDKFESGQATKQALVDAETLFMSNDWVKKYKDEASDAWERAVEYNELSGSKMTAEQLNEKAMGYFGKAVKRKGDDISQPFKAEGSGESEPDFSPFDRAVAKMAEAKGEAPQETK